MKRKFRDYQIDVIDLLLKNRQFALFMDMGMGKTICVLTAINELMYRRLQISKVLVIAPKSVAETVWDEEAKLWPHVRHLRFSKIVGSEAQRLEALKKEADIYVISVDNLAWLAGQFGSWMLPFDCVVVDESSRFKNHAAIRTEALTNFIFSAKRRIIMTGTPVPNGLIDLYSQIYLLDRGKRLGRNITAYRNEYFIRGPYNEYILRPGKEKKIYEAIKDISVSLKRPDYIDTKEPSFVYLNIRMPDALKKKYKAFEKEKVIDWLDSLGEDEPITAINAAALTSKLQQFANGAVYDADKNYHIVHKLKIQRTIEVIEEAQGSPVLIAYAFKHDREMLIDGLKRYKPRVYRSAQDGKDWNAGKLQVMLIHPGSAGHGLNLQYGGHLFLWYGLTFNLEWYLQANKRIDRPGQEEHVSIIHANMVGTVEDRIINVLKGKETRQAGLLKAVKLLINEYKKDEKQSYF